ncbi:MAG: 6-phosphofructokinase [Clostridiales bacterium]|nr:6-phosphofructokinase [Clostridiales bacterium]
MKVGLLTSGGDCQGLNAVLRGVAKSLYNSVPDLELYGIIDGYHGLITAEWRKMKTEEFSDILRMGGTILGTSRQPFKEMQVLGEDNTDKLSMMLKNYNEAGFDALVILGGNGTHKTAQLLNENGVNVVTLPKTIDNDVYGTDICFGFDSAVEKATSVIDAIHTTAVSHGRVFVVELMGNKVGWLSLYAGIAGGADIILIPEIPYYIEKVLEVIDKRNTGGKKFTIIAIAEGAVSAEEAALPKKERAPDGLTAGARLAKILSGNLDQDVRTAIPGHFQRGGDPTPTDRILCSRLGAKAGELISSRQFGYMVAVRGDTIVKVPLEEVAGKTKSVPTDSQILYQAGLLGISIGV